MGIVTGAPGKEFRPIRVLILDDHPVVAAGLENYINLSGDIVVTGTWQTDHELLEAVRRDPPDLVILDLLLPGCRMDGIEVAHYLRQHHGHIKLLALSAFTDVSRVVRAVRADVDGYLSKTTDCIGIVDAIRQIVYGNQKLYDPVVGSIIRGYMQGDRSGREYSADYLTEREWEVLEHIASGATYSEIARTLYISLATVKSHAQKICGKLGVRDREQARTWYYFASEEEKQAKRPTDRRL